MVIRGPSVDMLSDSGAPAGLANVNTVAIITLEPINPTDVTFATPRVI